MAFADQPNRLPQLTNALLPSPHPRPRSSSAHLCIPIHCHAAKEGAHWLLAEVVGWWFILGLLFMSNLLMKQHECSDQVLHVLLQME